MDSGAPLASLPKPYLVGPRSPPARDRDTAEASALLQRSSLGPSRTWSCTPLRTHLTFPAGRRRHRARGPAGLSRPQCPARSTSLIVPSWAVFRGPQMSPLRGQLGRVTLPASEGCQGTRPDGSAAHVLHPPLLPCSSLGGPR